MALTPRLDLRQSQSLVMTPQLQQAIKLLQLSNLDLAAYVEQQLEENPLLERERPDDEGVCAEPDAGDVPQPGEALRGVDRVLADESGFSSDAALDVDYDNLFDGGIAATTADKGGAELNLGSMSALSRQGGDGGESSVDFESTVAGRQSLRDFLAEQLALDIADPVDRMIGFQLIEMLDDAGYIVGDLHDVAEMLGSTFERVEAVLFRVQQFEPTGVFARTLAECLSLQLRERERLDEPMQALLDNLDLLGKGDLPALTRACNATASELGGLIAELRSLNPKPALAFDDGSATQPVIPDVLMRRHPDGGWTVELNSETLPRVLVNNHYFIRLNKNSKKKEEKKYISECFQTANWLVRSLHQRANTIIKVSAEIVRQQEEFFLGGVQYLRPLILRDIASAVQLHESTVSRVTSNKYMMTPRGTYELKYFFSQGIGSKESGEGHSAAWVRHRIRVLVDGEAANEVLSDDSIVEFLRREGIDIARRTVAKYREALGIPSSVHRRRQKCGKL
jgi:RNA polymerase sigma-54 factor